MPESLVGERRVEQSRFRDNLVAHALISERMFITSYEPAREYKFCCRNMVLTGTISVFAQEAAEVMGCLERVTRKVESGCESTIIGTRTSD